MIPKVAIPLILLATASLAACELGTEARAEEAKAELTLQADTAILAARAATWTARVLDGKGAAIAGTKVQFSVAYNGEPNTALTPFFRDSALTDEQGYARVRSVPFNHGTIQVRAQTVVNGAPDSAAAAVRVRPSVSITRLNGDGAPLDSVALQGPHCSPGFAIFGTGTTLPGNSNFSFITYSVENPEVALVARISSGGNTGVYGRQIVARLPGTTRIIATADHGGVDTLLVRVTPAAQPLSILRRMPFDRPAPFSFTSDSLVVARGDTAGLTIATEPGNCDARFLPSNFAVALESADPSVVRIEATEAKQWTVETIGIPLSIGTNARLRGGVAGRTEVVATAPYSAPKRITVIVQ